MERNRGPQWNAGKQWKVERCWIAGYCLLPLAFVIFSALALSGCSGPQRTPPMEVWPDMKKQGKYLAQTEGPRIGADEQELFNDGRSNRAPVAGTIAHGHLRDDSTFNTGMEGGMFIGQNPIPLDAALLQQGQAKFNTYCSPCHDRTGGGQGIVPIKAPTWQPSNLVEERVRAFNDGEIFNVITHGRRSMPSYRFQITERDRWAIVAYVRALQRAASGTVNDVPQELKAQLR